MELTLEQAQKMMDENGGYLDLRGTGITALGFPVTVVGSRVYIPRVPFSKHCGLEGKNESI